MKCGLFWSIVFSTLPFFVMFRGYTAVSCILNCVPLCICMYGGSSDHVCKKHRHVPCCLFPSWFATKFGRVRPNNIRGSKCYMAVECQVLCTWISWSAYVATRPAWIIVFMYEEQLCYPAIKPCLCWYSRRRAPYSGCLEGT